MRRNTVVSMVVGIAIPLVAYAAGQSSGQEAESAKVAAEAAEEMVETAGEATEALLTVADPDSKKAFAFTVTGEGLELPVVDGVSVMAVGIGVAVQYTFLGTVGIPTMTLHGVEKDQPGTFDPYGFSIMYPESNLACRYSAAGDGGKLSLEVEETADGVRGTFSGELSCRPLKDGEGEDWPKVGRLEGWYKR